MALQDRTNRLPQRSGGRNGLAVRSEPPDSAAMQDLPQPFERHLVALAGPASVVS